MSQPLIVASRGDTASAPENTLAAFTAAIDNGADSIEFDVHPTSDGELVVHHDYYLGRTTDGAGYIGDWPLNRLLQLDAGSWYRTEFRHQRIPTLTQVLELGRGRVRFEIELRGSTSPFLLAVLSEIGRLGVKDRVELTSPHIPLLCRLGHEGAGVSTGMFFPSPPEWMDFDLATRQIIDWMSLASARVAHLPARLLQPGIVRRIHARGFSVHGANLETVAEITAARDAEIDQFSTRHLSLAHRLRDSARTDGPAGVPLP